MRSSSSSSRLSGKADEDGIVLRRATVYCCSGLIEWLECTYRAEGLLSKDKKSPLKVERLHVLGLPFVEDLESEGHRFSSEVGGLCTLGLSPVLAEASERTTVLFPSWLTPPSNFCSCYVGCESALCVRCGGYVYVYECVEPH